MQDLVEKVFENYLWKKFELREEFKTFFTADYWDDVEKIKKMSDRKNRKFTAMRTLGLIYYHPIKQRYTRTRLGIEVSKIYS